MISQCVVSHFIPYILKTKREWGREEERVQERRRKAKWREGHSRAKRKERRRRRRNTSREGRKEIKRSQNEYNMTKQFQLRGKLLVK